MNKLFRNLIELAFSAFIGGLIVFTVSSFLELLWADRLWDETNANGASAPLNYYMLYRALAAITIATVLLFSSLKMPERLRVLENGLLAGGVFTTVYGLGSLSSYNSPSPLLNFGITLFALIIALAVGWIKFVKFAEAVQAAPPELGDVSERLSVVENTLARLKQSLSDPSD